MSTAASSSTDGRPGDGVRAHGRMSRMHESVVKVDGRRSRSSMREVAETAGVAMSSVSRVLSGHPDVSPVMRERVLAAVEELGYKPNILAQSLRRQETLSVGFVVRDISNPLMAEIVKAAETRLRESGYSMLLTNSESDPELDADHIRLFEQRRVDGLILSLTSEIHPRTNGLLEQLDVPCVLVDRDVPASVQAEPRPLRPPAGYARGGRASARPRAPADRSHPRRVGAPVPGAASGVRGGVRRAWSAEDVPHRRGRGVRGRARRAGRRPAARRVGAADRDRGRLEPDAPGRRPCDRRARPRDCPRDLSLVSCDDIILAELYRPPIAVVRHDNSEVGRLAAELLIEGMRDEGARLVTSF